MEISYDAIKCDVCKKSKTSDSHSRKGGNPSSASSATALWVPACAGLTGLVWILEGANANA